MRKFPTPEELSSLPPDGGDQYNRLVFESSPYLRQHASNAVDWYPWTEEAFAKARAESKPIFLSVGYSTCHWCHVMEHESFADDVVAELMNRKFVPIKLDREERPDLDHQYMAVTQAMQGQGGWPNSLFLTPNAEPFFAFTYLPKDQFLGLLSQISDLWETQMEQVAGRALDISRIVGGSLQAIRGGGSLAGIVESTCKNLLQNADEVNGGFGHAPKFPHADDLVLLTRCGDGDADRCVGLTLTKMRLGGIYDQLAGGFHRYSTDEKWLLPHFEKMLYDQASLVNAYSEAYAKQGTKLFKDTAIETLDFVDKYLSHPDGSFLSAMDADSEGEEGKSYVWTEVEIESVLGTDADVAKQMFGTSPNGNFIEERSKEKTGANVLVLTDSPHAAQIAPTSPFGRGPSLERSESGRGEGNRLAIIREKLLAARNERIQPQIDDKVLTDWNGMLIAAMARAGVLLGEHFYVQRAGKAAEVLLERFCLEKKLTHQAGKETAFLDDYAFFILALIELHQADFDPAWLRKAKEYADLLIKDFEDNVNSGFHMTREPLPGTGARPKAAMDSAHRSGYAAATTALIRLGRILQNPNYIDVARKAIEAASGDVAAMSTGHTGLVVAYDELNGGVEAVVVSNGREESEAAIKVLRANYAPRAIFIPVYPGSEAAEFAASLPMIENKITYYICRNYTCEFPTTEIDEVRGGLS